MTPHPPSISSTDQPPLNDSSTSHPLPLIDQAVPDGGVGAWCTVLGSFLAQFCGFGYSSAFGVYQDYYSRHYLSQDNSSAISWIGSLSAFLLSAISLICGPLHDRGHFHLVFVGGAILQSFSIFMISLVEPGGYYQVFLSQGLGSGIAQGLMYVPSYAILSQHFSKRRALVMSLVACGAPLGGITHTIMLNQLINGPIGFVTGVRISAAFVSILLFISCLLMRTRYGQNQSAVSVDTWLASKKCVTDVPFLLMIIAFLLYQIAFLYPLFYFQVDSLQHGLSSSFAFYSLVIVNAGSLCGRLSGGLLTSFIGVIDLTIFSTASCAVFFLGMIWMNNVAGFVTLGLLYGFSSGINIAMMAPVMALLTTNQSELGVRMGIGFAITGLGTLVGMPISGALLTSRYLWWAPALFCSAVALFGALLFLILRIMLRRRSKNSGQSTPQLMPKD